MTVSAASALLLLGIVVAAAAHLGCKVTERLARERYRELVGEEADLPEDGWQEIRPLAGRWGCLVAGLEFVRGMGVFLALGAVLYLVFG